MSERERQGSASEREEHYVVDCRHCRSKNRVLLERAVEAPFEVVCGGCRGKLFLEPDEPLTDLDPSCYEHPLDRAALKTLKQVPGVHSFLKFLIRELPERYMHLHNIQNYVKVGPNQLPKYHEMRERVTRLLALDYAPDLYIRQHPFPNAFTYGVERAYIVLHSSLVEIMDDREVEGVIAHEAAHIHMDHVLYRYAAEILATVGFRLLDFLPMGRAMVMPILLAFQHWYRCAELSADRGALLVTRDFRTGVGTCMKLAGGGGAISRMMSADEFLKQGEEAYSRQQENLVNTVMVTMQNAGATHPLAVWRAGAMKEWVQRGDYLDLIAGHYARRKRKSAPATVDLEKDEEFRRDDPKSERDFFDHLRGFFDSFTKGM